MIKGNILFICGSLNQTKMMHAISEHFEEYNLFFTPYYADGFLNFMTKRGLLDFTPLGGNHKRMTLNYLEENNLQMDVAGKRNNYDLVFTCSDLVVQNNIKDKKVILVQEGMTDPQNVFYYMVKYLNFPRWIASTSTTGLSDAYNFFCVASEGYKDLFVKKGVKREKLKVTGIPNFDNLQQYYSNDFPHKDFVLVATSDSRETLKYENRKKFIKRALDIAGDKKVVFKLHPNENFGKATKEINKYAPDAVVYTSGDINQMIANCDTLITRYSTVVYVGIVLGKKVYSYFDVNYLRKLAPFQNNGTSAYNIAQVGYRLLNEKKSYEFVPSYQTSYNEV